MAPVVSQCKLVSGWGLRKRNLCFLSPQPDTSLHCEVTTDLEKQPYSLGRTLLFTHHRECLLWTVFKVWSSGQDNGHWCPLTGASCHVRRSRRQCQNMEDCRRITTCVPWTQVSHLLPIFTIVLKFSEIWLLASKYVIFLKLNNLAVDWILICCHALDLLLYAKQLIETLKYKFSIIVYCMVVFQLLFYHFFWDGFELSCVFKWELLQNVAAFFPRLYIFPVISQQRERVETLFTYR